jgi:putative FmdB family regulatory protein
MPIYEYIAKERDCSCEHCVKGFDAFQKISDSPLDTCPQCESPIVKQISAHAVGSSSSGFDDRAKSAGFSKLERLGHGEYEKKY